MKIIFIVTNAPLKYLLSMIIQRKKKTSQLHKEKEIKDINILKGRQCNTEWHRKMWVQRLSNVSLDYFFECLTFWRNKITVYFPVCFHSFCLRSLCTDSIWRSSKYCEWVDKKWNWELNCHSFCDSCHSKYNTVDGHLLLNRTAPTVEVSNTMTQGHGHSNTVTK